MRNKFFIGLLFGLFLPLHLVSQTREDVVAINTAMWETKKISENIEVRQMRWPLLYGCAQTVTVAEITPKRGLAFDIAVADGGATVGEMARRTKALAAINGSYFDIHKRSAITYLRQGRTVIDTTTTAELALRVTGATERTAESSTSCPGTRQSSSVTVVGTGLHWPLGIYFSIAARTFRCVAAAWGSSLKSIHARPSPSLLAERCFSSP